MRKDISGIDLYYIVQELQELAGAKVDKIFHPAEKELILQMHIPNSGKKMLYFSGNFIYYTTKKEEMDKPSGFCSFIRKKLANGRCKEVKQIGSERILKMFFTTKDTELSLVFEFMPPRNIILLQDNTILAAAEQREFSDRKIKIGENYKTPASKVDLFEINLAKIEEILAKSNRENIVKSIAMDFGAGGMYAEEITFEANIDKKKKPIEINAEERERLLKAIIELKSKKISPFIVFENNKIKEIIPFKMKKFEGFELKQVSTYLEAFTIVLEQLRDQVTEAKKTSKYEEKIEKKKKILEEQQKRLAELEIEMEENSRKGNFIYENYQKVKEVLEKAKKGEIKDANKKEKSVSVEIN